tara:strand:- start:428 stop:787 length:360 start_codon:yes stop_codon:yes gene_type:complete
MNETKYFKDALELQVEAKKIGLDWLTTDGIILKLQEETFEVSEEIKKNNKTSIKEELGDLLFTFICLARHLDISIDDILLDANSKFKDRFEKVKKILDEQGLSYASPDEMNQIWELIKG